MEKDEQFLGEIAETIERLYDNAPPAIVLTGWWWKKYIPFFQRQQRVVDRMWCNFWERDGREAHFEMMKKERKNESFSIARKYRDPLNY